jgi:hypothetical protein
VTGRAKGKARSEEQCEVSPLHHDSLFTLLSFRKTFAAYLLKSPFDRGAIFRASINAFDHISRILNPMMRRILQIVLMIALLGGSAVQSLSCASQLADSHPCCRALATIKATTHAQALKKEPQTSLKGGSCGCAAAPTKPQETPVRSGSIQPNHTASIQDDAPIASSVFRSAFERPVRLCAPNDYSPPHFILYHALLI